MWNLRLLVVYLSLLWCVAGTAITAAVVLPIEITDPDGTVESITVTSAVGSTATAVWLRVHGLTYQEKASVQINNGGWIALRNDTAGLIVEGDAAGYGGIGGVWQTMPIRITLPAGVTVNGNNSIRFRFNQTNGLSSGWRVLDVNLLDSSGNRLIAANAFTHDDPATWQPPRNTAADIAAGDALWSGAALQSRPGGTAMKATCSLCHDPEARDLQYFSYSNKMIIARSVFHGLSTTQGEQIASYVRSNSIKRVGRPWNPPYQPGAGLDAKPGDEWAAGAGIDAVASDERQILAALPGMGTDLNAHMDANQRILPYNRREIPVAIQMMDWNHWLPTIHPIDSVSESAWNMSSTKTRYDAIRNGLLGQRGMTKDQYIRAQMRGEIDEWAGPEAKAGLGIVDDSAQGAETQEHYRRVHDILLNNVVRMWGLTMEFGLHDLGEQFYGSQGEKRFFMTDRMVFNMTPHIIGHNRTNQLRLVVDSSHDENLDWDGVSDAWYEMQMILNGGQRNSFRGGHHDVDWKYIWYFVSANNDFKYYPILGLTAAWKSLQEIDGGYGPDGLRRSDDLHANTWWGFSLRDGRPEMGHMLQRDWGPSWSADQQRNLLIPLYVAWVRKLASFDLESWTFANPSEFYRQKTYILGTSPGDSYPEIVGDEITTMKARGYPDALINALADHGAALWPNNDWTGMKRPASASVGVPKGVTASAGAGRITLTWTAVSGATSYNVQRAEGSSSIYQGIGLLTTATTWIDNLLVPGRTYSYQVSANVATAVSSASATVVATVGSGLVMQWHFDEASGNQVADATGGHVTGTLIADPVRSIGKIGNGLTLTGASRYDRNSFVSSSQNLNRWLNRSATLMAWVKTTATGNDDDWRKPGLAGTWRESADHHIENWWYLGGLNANGTVSACYGLGNTVSSTKPINDGAWHHVSISREEASGAIQFVIDGVAAGTGNSSAGFQAARAFGIGRVDVTGSTIWEESYRYWPGQLDEVRIYDRVLSVSEVQGIYASEVNVTPPPQPPPQPAPWQSTDIGGSVGKTVDDGSGRMEVTGSGSDIWGTKDGFRLVGQTLTGDGELVAKVDSLQNTNSWAKAGVMIRESTAVGSRHVFCAVTPGNGVAFQYRSSTNGSSSHIAGSRSAAPRWVRLVRMGTRITGYESVDGTSWTTVGTTTLSLSGPVWFGLAVTSHAGPGTPATANFSSVVMTSKNNG